MRKLPLLIVHAILALIVCFLIIFAKGKYDTYSYGVERGGVHYTVYAYRMSELAIRYREESEYGDVRYWTNYTWNSTTTNILINAANYPTLTAGDTVFIPTRSGGAGYRSYTLNGVSSGAPNQYIVIDWLPGTYITTNTSSPIFANSINNIYGVKTVHMTMNDNIDVAFSSYSSGSYSQYVWFDSCTYIGMNGFFPSTNPTLTTPNFTGDTVNCFYMWRWSHCTWDSLVGGNSGNTALNIGNIAKNNTWIHTEVDHCLFGDYSSSSSPAGYIHALNVFGLYIHDDSLWNLGKNVPSPVGHAAQIFLQTCYYEIYNCYFGPNNFGNCVRSFGSDDIPSMFNTFSQWSVGYNGRSRIYNCIDADSRKYPFYETRQTPTDTTALSPYPRVRTSAEVWYISAVRLNAGICCNGYSASIVDCYENDSLFLKGSFECGASDTVWGACTSTTCVKLITTPNGAVTKWDTATTRFVSSAFGVGLLDSTLTYHPNTGSGLLYNQSIAPPSYISTDYYGSPRRDTNRSPGVDIGAVQASGNLPPTSGSGIILRRGARNRIYINN